MQLFFSQAAPSVFPITHMLLFFPSCPQQQFLHQQHPLLAGYFTRCHHVIVRNRVSFSMVSRGVAAGANPSLVSGRGQGTPWTSRQLIIDEQCGVQYLAQRHFNMQLSLVRSGNLNYDLSITSRPALPTELQPPLRYISVSKSSAM